MLGLLYMNSYMNTLYISATMVYVLQDHIVQGLLLGLGLLGPHITHVHQCLPILQQQGLHFIPHLGLHIHLQDLHILLPGLPIIQPQGLHIILQPLGLHIILHQGLHFIPLLSLQ